MRKRIEKALAAMRELEAGATANPDEGRMAGHWLRDSKLAPNASPRDIDDTNSRIKQFAADARRKIAPQNESALGACAP
jgi:glucose-6-phosphate isomerase